MLSTIVNFKNKPKNGMQHRLWSAKNTTGLLKEIERLHIKSRNNLKKGQPSPYDHPTSIAKTIRNSQPVSTNEIVQRKLSRFH